MFVWARLMTQMLMHRPDTGARILTHRHRHRHRHRHTYQEAHTHTNRHGHGHGHGHGHRPGTSVQEEPGVVCGNRARHFLPGKRPSSHAAHANPV